MLTRVVIENYRSCLRTAIDLDPKLSVLIGPNSSGKTNILQAIMLLNKMTQEGHLRPELEGVSPVSSRLKATFRQDGAQLQLSASVNVFADEANNDVMVGSRQKWLIRASNGRKASFELPLAIAADFGRISTQHYYPGLHYVTLAGGKWYRSPRPYKRFSFPHAISKWTMQALIIAARYCHGIRYYGASQFTNPGTCPPSFEIEQEATGHTVVRLRGHRKILHNMYSAAKAGSSGYARFLDIVGPKGLRLIDDLRFREVQTSSVDHSVRVGGRIEVQKRHKLLIVPQFRIGRQKLSPNQLSEGTFKTLALLFYIITEASTALLIEEPEVCVHQGLLSSIIELIKSYSAQKQMVISTHSDYVLDHVNPENVYRVKFERSTGTVVRHIPKAMTTKELSALREYLENEGNLGEYWREGGLGDRL